VNPKEIEHNVLFPKECLNAEDAKCEVKDTTYELTKDTYVNIDKLESLTL